MVNIKLDKCGGLTEAMKMVQWCRENNIELMVGNMLGSSLAMAPGFIVAQHCKFVDLDGPLWQKTDRSTPLQFENSVISAPESKLWG
jgi:L-alanine-DL-glutamate epimerase-like enolase superfamily enzyme